jgi:hypothetical protein
VYIRFESLASSLITAKARLGVGVGSPAIAGETPTGRTRFRSYIGHQCEECEDELATGCAAVITVVVGVIQFKDQATSRLACCRPAPGVQPHWGRTTMTPTTQELYLALDSKPEYEAVRLRVPAA